MGEDHDQRLCSLDVCVNNVVSRDGALSSQVRLDGVIVVHRAMTVAAVVMLATAACSSAGGDAGDPEVGAVSDPVATFCSDWARFDALTNSDDDPTPALLQEVLDLQDEIGGVLPEGFEAGWASILDWNTTFIEWFQTTGYEQPSDEIYYDLLGGEQAAAAASQARGEAYEAIRTWSRTNCPEIGRRDVLRAVAGVRRVPRIEPGAERGAGRSALRHAGRNRQGAAARTDEGMGGDRRLEPGVHRRLRTGRLWPDHGRNVPPGVRR